MEDSIFRHGTTAAAEPGHGPAETARPGTNKNPLGIIAPYFGRYAPRLAVGMFCLLLVDLLQLVVPRILKTAVDSLERGVATQQALTRLGLAIIGVAVAIGLLRYVWRQLLFGFSRLVEMHLRDRLLAHVLMMDQPFFQRRPPGDIMALATNDLTVVQMACGMGMVACFDGVLMTLAAVCFMAYINPTLTLIALLPMPVLALLTRVMALRMHHRFNKVQEQFSRMTEFARGAIANVRLIMAYNQEPAQVERFDAMGQVYIRDNVKLAILHGVLFPLAWLTANASLLLVMLFGGRLAVLGRITLGDFVAFMSYLALLTWPIMAMGWVVSVFQRGWTSLARIRRLLDERPVKEDAERAPDGWRLEGGLSLRNLTFSYPSNDNDENHPALRDVTLDLPLGVTGIVGKTGSGKSTLCRVLTRTYQVEPGALFYGQVDARTLPLAATRPLVAYVPQDVTVFSDTIAYNISMGKPDATPAEIEEAARAASIHDEILEMPDGYATRVGERGVKLSGGQRQRLALARALLLDRPILIIDDALSAVDLETESRIIASLSGRLKDRVCVIVSHRIAPLADAGRIVVLKNGAIEAIGTHEQLLETNRFYAAVYRHQTALESN